MFRYAMALIAALLLAATCGAFTIAADGAAEVGIVLPDQPTAEEKEAATELATYLGKVTGAQFEPVAENAHAGGPAIFVGATRVTAQANVDAAHLDRDGFVIRLIGDKLFIIGYDAASTELGVHYFLQWYAGVRWYIPLEIGEHIPDTPNLSVPDDLDIAREPAWQSRQWSSAARMDPVYEKRNLVRPRYKFHHYLLHAIKPSETYDAHPEWFPFQNGKRIANPGDESHGWQPCFSNDELIRYVAEKIIAYFDANPAEMSYSLGINDVGAGGYCQCENCQALDDPSKPEFRDRPNYSNRVFHFMNAVAEITSQKYPDKLLGCLAYHNCEEVPSFPVHPNIVPYLTNDRAQWINDDFRAEDQDLLRRWSKAARQLGVYDYYYGSGYVIPRFFPRVSAESIKFCHDVGVRAWYAEIYSNWALDGCKCWLASRLLWDASQDADALVEEYYTDLFGAAAEPMRKYWQRCEQVWESQGGESHWFKGFFDIGQLDMFPREVCIELRGYLREAERLADTELVKRRVRFYRNGFRYTDLYSQVYWSDKAMKDATVGSARDVQAVADALLAYTSAEQQLRELYATVIDPDPLMRPVIPFHGRAKLNYGQGLVSGLSRVAIWAEANDGWAVVDEALAGLAEQDSDGARNATRYLRARRNLIEARDILPNPGFEANVADTNAVEGIHWTAEGCPPGWSSWIRPGSAAELQWIKDPVRSGEYAVMLKGVAGAACYIKSVPIEAGKSYLCSAWAWAKHQNPRRVELKVQWQDAQGKWFTGAGPVGDSVREPDTRGWVPLECMFTAPEGAAYAVVAVLCEGMEPDEYAYFDDCSLKEMVE